MAEEEFIDWNDELKTGITIIDEEHKFLIENINFLFDVVNEKEAHIDDSDEAIGRILENLVHYAHTHFVVEEEFMRVYRFEGLAEHKAEHDEFASRLISLNEDFKEHSLNLSVSLVRFLKDWLSNHILTVDQKMAEFLRAKGQN